MSRRACFSSLWFAAAVLHLSILMLWPMTMRAASAEEMQAAGTEEPSYEDTYLFESDATGAESYYAAEAAEESGRRYISTEVVYYGSETDGFGSTTEQGVRLRWGQETLRFGTLEAEFTVSNFEQDFLNSPRDVTESTISLRQIGVPIVDGYEMNNALGYQRLRSDAYVAGGYRVRLPSSPLMGFSGEIAGFDRSARIFAGRTGQIDGVAFNQFRRDGGDVWGVAYVQDLKDGATVAAQLVSFDGNDLVGKHSSLLTSASFAYPELEAQYDVSLLADDDGNLGFWADAEQVVGNNILARYGAFYLGPGLAWMDTPIANDQVGFYARADKQSYGLSLSAGYDFLRYGFGSTSRARTSTHNIHLNGSFQLSRALTLGVTGSVLTRDISSEIRDRQLVWRLNNYAYLKSYLGRTRFELFKTRVEADLALGISDSTGLAVSHDWQLPRALQLTTEFRIEDAERNGADFSHAEATIMLRHRLLDNLNWGIGASAIRFDEQQGSASDGVSLNADLRWAFDPDWHVSLLWTYNETKRDAFVIPPETPARQEIIGNTFWLTLGFARTAGRPLQILGSNSEGIGSGRVEGTVFYDENGDFVRQASEQPAVGVVVVLDGRYEARTDSQGRYVFEPVFTGGHQVEVPASELPLPWGLHNETPQIVNVGIRSPGEANFALSRFD